MEPLVLVTGAAAAAVLLEPGHQDAVCELVGEAALTQGDIAAVLARELGRGVAVEETGRQTWRVGAEARGRGGYQLDGLLRVFEYYEAFGLPGNPKGAPLAAGPAADHLGRL